MQSLRFLNEVTSLTTEILMLLRVIIILSQLYLDVCSSILDWIYDFEANNTTEGVLDEYLLK